jgi:hypothetical protein
MDLDFGAMRIHCPVAAFDDLLGALGALDAGEAGAVENAARLAREYDRGIGDLTRHQRAMLRVAAGASPHTTRREAARVAFRSIARAVVAIHDKKNGAIRKKGPPGWRT